MWPIGRLGGRDLFPRCQDSWLKAVRLEKTASEEPVFSGSYLAMDRGRVPCTRQNLSRGYVSGTPINLAGPNLEYSFGPAKAYEMPGFFGRKGGFSEVTDGADGRFPGTCQDAPSKVRAGRKTAWG